jgi:hypothetical protein
MKAKNKFNPATVDRASDVSNPNTNVVMMAEERILLENKTYANLYANLDAIYLKKRRLGVLESDAMFAAHAKKGLISPANLMSDSIHNLLREVEAIKKVDGSYETTRILCKVLEEAIKIVNHPNTPAPSLLDLDKFTQTLPNKFGANKINHARNLGIALSIIGAAVMLATILFAFPFTAPLLALAYNPVMLPAAVLIIGNLITTVGLLLFAKFDTVESGKTARPAYAIKANLFSLFTAKRDVDRGEVAIKKPTLMDMAITVHQLKR